MDVHAALLEGCGNFPGWVARNFGALRSLEGQAHALDQVLATRRHACLLHLQVQKDHQAERRRREESHHPSPIRSDEKVGDQIHGGAGGADQLCEILDNANVSSFHVAKKGNREGRRRQSSCDSPGRIRKNVGIENEESYAPLSAASRRRRSGCSVSPRSGRTGPFPPAETLANETPFNEAAADRRLGRSPRKRRRVAAGGSVRSVSRALRSSKRRDCESDDDDDENELRSVSPDFSEAGTCVDDEESDFAESPRRVRDPRVLVLATADHSTSPPAADDAAVALVEDVHRPMAQHNEADRRCSNSPGENPYHQAPHFVAPSVRRRNRRRTPRAENNSSADAAPDVGGQAMLMSSMSSSSSKGSSFNGVMVGGGALIEPRQRAGSGDATPSTTADSERQILSEGTDDLSESSRSRETPNPHPSCLHRCRSRSSERGEDSRDRSVAAEVSAESGSGGSSSCHDVNCSQRWPLGAGDAWLSVEAIEERLLAKGAEKVLERAAAAGSQLSVVMKRRAHRPPLPDASASSGPSTASSSSPPLGPFVGWGMADELEELESLSKRQRDVLRDKVATLDATLGLVRFQRARLKILHEKLSEMQTDKAGPNAQSPVAATAAGSASGSNKSSAVANERASSLRSGTRAATAKDSPAGSALSTRKASRRKSPRVTAAAATGLCSLPTTCSNSPANSPRAAASRRSSVRAEGRSRSGSPRSAVCEGVFAPAPAAPHDLLASQNEKPSFDAAAGICGSCGHQAPGNLCTACQSLRASAVGCDLRDVASASKLLAAAVAGEVVSGNLQQQGGHANTPRALELANVSNRQQASRFFTPLGGSPTSTTGSPLSGISVPPAGMPSPFPQSLDAQASRYLATAGSGVPSAVPCPLQPHPPLRSAGVADDRLFFRDVLPVSPALWDASRGGGPPAKREPMAQPLPAGDSPWHTANFGGANSVSGMLAAQRTVGNLPPGMPVACGLQTAHSTTYGSFPVHPARGGASPFGVRCFYGGSPTATAAMLPQRPCVNTPTIALPTATVGQDVATGLAAGRGAAATATRKPRRRSSVGSATNVSGVGNRVATSVGTAVGSRNRRGDTVAAKGADVSPKAAHLPNGPNGAAELYQCEPTDGCNGLSGSGGSEVAADESLTAISAAKNKKGKTSSVGAGGGGGNGVNEDSASSRRTSTSRGRGTNGTGAMATAKAKSGKTGDGSAGKDVPVVVSVEDWGEWTGSCPVCGAGEEGQDMVACDGCNDWFHFTCVGYADTKDDDWFCTSCEERRGRAVKGAAG